MRIRMSSVAALPFYVVAIAMALPLHSAAGDDSRAAPTALLWLDPAMEAISGLAPRGIRAALEEAGCSVQCVATTEFATGQALDPAKARLVVFPYGPLYPASLGPSLVAFVEKGGTYMTLGGASFRTPLFDVNGHWQSVHATGKTLNEVTVAAGWTVADHGAEDNAVLSLVAAGEAIGALQVSVDLAQYAYVGSPIEPVPVADAVLCFDAQGDAATARLCVELQEQDGSRWKYAVPLTDEWRSHAIHLASFASYASALRGARGDFPHGDRLARLLFGFTRSMVGAGARRFGVRNVRIAEAAVPSIRVVATPVFPMPETPMETWFGKDLRRRETLPDVSCFAGSRPVTWDGLRPGPDQALAPQAVPASGAWRGWSVSGPAPDAPAGAGKRDAWLHQFRARQAAAAACVLLQGARGAGQTDTAALLAIQRTSRFRGSAWVAFGTEHVDLTHPTAKLLRDAVVAAARLVTQGIAFDPLQPEFRIQDGKVVMDVFLTGRCFGAAPRKIALQATVRSGARDAWPRHTRHIELQPGSWPRLRWLEAVPVETFDPQCFEVSVVPVAADLATVGSAVFALDAKQALRDVGDFLVQAGLDDRKYHGFAFIDNRAARGLLGAFEILGDERYRQSALAWGQAMLDEQREDGGYRMGYGITSRGEECYVADGGEIAVGMARLVSYTDRPRREQYLDSLRRYMAYRDSFRVPEGGIGVGWCLSDYGARPIVPLETPTKIFAPEINTYTIGCSLAAAYALARLRGEPDLERAAERDADWLMPRTKSLHGAYCESFVYAHAFTSDAARRELYATYLLEHFVAPILANKPGWWTWGAGRSALNLDGLVYCHERLGQTPELQRAILEAASAMFAPQGSDSLYTLVRGEPPRQRSDALLYLCYSYLSLADLVRPMVTMDKFVPGP